MPVDPDSFRSALAQFASGVTVVTTRDHSQRLLGLTVSAFCSVSLEPPLILICVDRRSEANAGLGGSGLFGVSVLAEGQEEVSRRFAWGGADKFNGFPLDTGADGVALVPGAVAQLACRTTASLPAGDHIVYVAEVLALRVKPGRPLVYHASGYRRLGPG
jgi:flavin reductase (DIM6/NTAB) family NADH-FMN oxidoreductase RutF